MIKSKIETKSKTKIIFEKLTVEEEKKVLGSGDSNNNGIIIPPSLLDC